MGKLPECKDGEGASPKTSSPPLRRLAIVGSHPNTRGNAPYDDPRYEIWLFNESPMKVPETYGRWDGCIQIHIPEVYTSLENWVNKDYWQWLQQDHGEKRIFMQEKDPRVPNAVQYPLEGVLALLPKEYHYIRSSPAFAMALAVYLGYQWVELYGCDLTSNTEYAYQASNLTFWIGFMLGHGVHFELCCWKDEFYSQPLYGYEGEYQVDKNIMQTRLGDAIEENGRHEKTYGKLKAKLDEAIWKHDYKGSGEFSFRAADCAVECARTLGMKQELEYYLERSDRISRQEFERRSADWRQKATEAEKAMYVTIGKCEYVWNAWMKTGEITPLQLFRHFQDERIVKARDYGDKLGRCNINLQLMHEYDKGVTALGGKTAMKQVMHEAGVDTRPGKV